MQRLPRIGGIGVRAAGSGPLSASAEVVYNRGNSADPESLDPHKTSTVYEAHILRDLFEGLVAQDADARHRSRAPPRAGRSRPTARSIRSSCARTTSGRTAIRSPPTTSSSPSVASKIPETAAEYASMLYVGPECRGGQQARRPSRRSSASRPSIRQTLEVTLKAPTPYFLEMLTHQATYPVSKALGREVRRRLGQARQHRLERRLHARRVRPERPHQARQEPEVLRCRERQDRRRQLRPDRGPIDGASSASRPASSTPMTTCRPSSSPTSRQVRRPDPYRRPISAPITIVFKSDKEPWSNTKLRRAISMAIDRDFLAEKVWQNSMIPAIRWCRRAIKGYETGDDGLCRACRSSTARTRPRRS